MAKFHISPSSGEPKSCTAIYQCPFGGDEDHYSAADEARAAYEASMEEEIFNSALSKSSFFDAIDPAVADEIVGGAFRFENFSLDRDYNEYDSTVWRGEETSTDGYAGVEVWVSNRYPYSVSGYIEIRGEKTETVFTEKFEEEFTDDMRAAAFTHLVTKAKTLHPEIFDQESEIFKKRLALQEEIKGGSVTIAGHTLHNLHGVAPQIWETSEVNDEDISEVYVRVRHDFASGRLIDSAGESHAIHSQETVSWHQSDAAKALFFMKFNDEILRWQAENA